MGEMPYSESPLRVSLQKTGDGTAERASHKRRPFHSSSGSTERTRFFLDRPAATEAIAGLWGLSPQEPGAWRLDRFGPDLATSVEVLAGVVFSRHRRLVGGWPDFDGASRVEIRVFPVASDTHSHPALVAVSGLGGPMLCHGIEDLASELPDPWGASPDTLLDALEYLLAVAAAAIDGREVGPAVAAAGSGAPLVQPIG